MMNVKSSGNFNKTIGFINKFLRGDTFSELDHYGQLGVDALSRATPVETGLSANSWYYKIIKDHRRARIQWHNTNTVNGTPVVILIQYGHGTGTGGYVEGRDFINPAIQPVFDQISDNVWKKVIS